MAAPIDQAGAGGRTTPFPTLEVARNLAEVSLAPIRGKPCFLVANQD